MFQEEQGDQCDCVKMSESETEDVFRNLGRDQIVLGPMD